jgi:hypothetical protein
MAAPTRRERGTASCASDRSKFNGINDLFVRRHGGCAVDRIRRRDSNSEVPVKDQRSVLPPDDHPDLPMEGGSEPVPHVREGVPGPGASTMQWLVIALCVLVAVFSVMWIFGL